MLDWLSTGALLNGMARVLLVWLAFYGGGCLLASVGPLRRYLRNVPRTILGMLGMAALVPLLSAPGILNRWSCSVLILALAAWGCLSCLGERERLKELRFPGPVWLQAGLLLILALIVLTNIFYAGWVSLYMMDPLVTYAVQPARWLSAGRMYFLGEMQFSGFPLLGEMIFVWPTALSADRMDQLQLLQLFNMSVLVALVPMAFRVLKVHSRMLIPTCIAVLSCNLLLIWTRVAKPDALALMFVTLALSILARYLISEADAGGSIHDYSPFLLMGAALSTKQTTAVALVPFAVMTGALLLRRRLRASHIPRYLLVLGAIPAVFAVRTMLHTGSPFYHIGRIGALLKEQWVKPQVPAVDRLIRANMRFRTATEGGSFPAGLMHSIATWEASGIILSIGSFVALVRKRASAYAPVILGISLYALAATAIFSPTWWGDKYAIMIIPFAGLAGAKMVGRSRPGFHAAWMLTVLSVVVYFSTAPFWPLESVSPWFRAGLTESFLRRQWALPGEPVYLPPALGVQMWANAHLPESTVLVSLNEWHRHFSDHPVVVATRHPIGIRLYLDNTAGEEMAILERMGADYVYFQRNPSRRSLPLRKLELLRYVGQGAALEPVTLLGETVLYRVNYHWSENAERAGGESPAPSKLFSTAR